MNNCKYCKDDGDACARCGCRGKSAKAGLTWNLPQWAGGHSEPATDTRTEAKGHGHSGTGTLMSDVHGASFKAQCVHDGTLPLWTLSNGTVLYGARGGTLAASGKVGHLDTILDLAGLVKPRSGFIVEGPRKYLGINRAAFPDVIRFNWPDMSAPTGVPLRFWRQLLKALKGQHVAVACMGSHGRTGTCLGALLIADGKGDGDRVIGMVREAHCSRAIETPQQEAYLRALGNSAKV